MASPVHLAPVYRFGIFEVVASSREIFRQGHRIKLQDQPFQLLLLLLKSPGEIVDREHIRQHLWPNNTFVEFGQSLSAAVTKLRQALGDDANNPRFIETIPRHGYRFIAPVSVPGDTSRPIVPDAIPPQKVTPPDLSSRDAAPNLSASHARVRGDRQIYVWSSLVAVLLAGVLTLLWHQRRPAFALSATDTIVLADFENTTGEMIFNDALRQGLLVGLAQSPVANVLPERRAAIIFRQMGRSPDERLTGRTALELCRRVGGKVTVQGSISSLGTTYLIGLAAIRCDTGKLIAHEQEEAPQKEDVIVGLGKATARIRSRLGESLPSIAKYNAPLEQATTSSLEALNAYGAALSTWDAKGDAASLPLFKKATGLDPNFAMAYGGLATVYSNLGDAELGRKNTVKAYQLRDRVTEAERASIDARYYLYVTEEIDKVASTYERMAREYPELAGSQNHLGATQMRRGQNEEAVATFRKALVLDASRATTYANLAISLFRLNKTQEAAIVLAEAGKRGLHTDYLMQTNYWLAFLTGDREAMDRLLQQSSQIPSANGIVLCEQANTEAFYGRFEKARELSNAAAELMVRSGDNESAASCLGQAAVREAEVGFTARARSLMEAATRLGNNKEIAISTALVAARTGDQKRALSVSGILDRQFPHGTFVQNYWLPTIRAEVALKQGHGENAVSLLSAAIPFDSVVADEFTMSLLYPVYVRGNAYLAAGDGNKAGDEFERLIDHPGMVLNLPFGALAQLGRARACKLAGRPAEARGAYEKFFKLWADADRGIPILRQARQEFDRLPTAAQVSAVRGRPGRGNS
jgi:DNA-binding winged helix-turn-helix (wHTH) protein/tetratricopeptide (TPR) repeat protein